MRVIFVLAAFALFTVISFAGQRWETIDARELNRRLHTPPPPLLLDIRGRDAYLAGALPQALNAGTDPAGFLPDGHGGDLVLVTRQPVDTVKLESWVERLVDARHRVFLLQGGVGAWQAAGLPLIESEQTYVRPGTVPFIIPRGLCEGDDPAQEYR